MRSSRDDEGVLLGERVKSFGRNSVHADIFVKFLDKRLPFACVFSQWDPVLGALGDDSYLSEAFRDGKAVRRPRPAERSRGVVNPGS